MWEWVSNLLNNPWFYVALVAFGTYFFSVWKSTAGKVPGLKNMGKGTLFMVGLVGLAITSGFLGSFSTGSLGTSGSAGITDFQVTTAFNSSCTVAEDSTIPDLMHVRCTDAQVLDGDDEVNTGLITVTRSGKLEAESYTVKALSADYVHETTPSNGVSYNILEKNALLEPAVFLQDGAVATTSSPRAKSTLAFGEGVAQKTLGITMQYSEDGHDALNQYSSRDVVVYVGGKGYTFRVHRMD